MTAYPPRQTFHPSASPFDSVRPVLDLRAVVARVGRQKVWLVVPALIAVVALLLIYPLIPLRYQANAQILIDPRGLQVVDKDISPNAQNGEASLTLVESQVRVITSESVLRDLMIREKLQDDPEFTDPLGLVSTIMGPFNKAFGVGEPREDPMLRALRTLQRRVSVKRTERSFIIDVFFDASSATKAAHLANALVDTYLAKDFTVRTEAAKRVEQSLSGRLSELRSQVQKAEERVEAYKAQNHIVGASGRLINEQQLLELNAQLSAARSRTAEVQARSELIARARAAGTDSAATAEALQSSTIGQMRTQYLEIKRRQSDVTTLLGARHPEVITLAAQARTVAMQISEELDRIARSARDDYERAKSKEVALSRSVDALKGDAMTTSRAFVRLRELEREAESSRSVYESFLRRTKEVGEQQMVDTASLRVTSRAVPPREPMNLSLPLLLVGALVAGLGLGVVIVLLRDALRQPAIPNSVRADALPLSR